MYIEKSRKQGGRFELDDEYKDVVFLSKINMLD